MRSNPVRSNIPDEVRIAAASRRYRIGRPAVIYFAGVGFDPVNREIVIP